MSTNTIYVNRDASRDVNLMPVVIPTEIASVIPAYTTPYIACRQSSYSVCYSEHQMSSTGHCSFVVPEQIQHYSVVPHHVQVNTLFSNYDTMQVNTLFGNYDTIQVNIILSNYDTIQINTLLIKQL